MDGQPVNERSPDDGARGAAGARPGDAPPESVLGRIEFGQDEHRVLVPIRVRRPREPGPG